MHPPSIFLFTTQAKINYYKQKFTAFFAMASENKKLAV